MHFFFFMANIVLAARFRELKWYATALVITNMDQYLIWDMSLQFSERVLSFTLSSGDKGVIAAALIGIE